MASASLAHCTSPAPGGLLEPGRATCVGPVSWARLLPLLCPLGPGCRSSSCPPGAQAWRPHAGEQTAFLVPPVLPYQCCELGGSLDKSWGESLPALLKTFHLFWSMSPALLCLIWSDGQVHVQTNLKCNSTPERSFSRPMGIGQAASRGSQLQESFPQGSPTHPGSGGSPQGGTLLSFLFSYRVPGVASIASFLKKPLHQNICDFMFAV